MPVRDFTRLAAAAAAAASLGCGPLTDVEPEPTKPSLSISVDPGVQLASYMDRANIALTDRGAGYRVVIAEYVSTGSDGRFGGTVLAKFVGNKRLGEDFIPGDPLRAAQGTGRPEDITYVVDRTADAAPPRPMPRSSAPCGPGTP